MPSLQHRDCMFDLSVLLQLLIPEAILKDCDGCAEKSVTFPVEVASDGSLQPEHQFQDAEDLL
jgi:hypothetical protein